MHHCMSLLVVADGMAGVGSSNLRTAVAIGVSSVTDRTTVVSSNEGATAIVRGFKKTYAILRNLKAGVVCTKGNVDTDGELVTGTPLRQPEMVWGARQDFAAISCITLR
jgi:hypothetical protein